MTNLGKIDPSLTTYTEESLASSNSYYLNSQIDRNSFNLVVRNPTGNYKNIRGHIKVLVHSKFARSEYDTKPTREGIIAARDAIQYAYTIQEWDFTSEKYGATDCISSVYLMPGDIVEAAFTMENPVDFISGDYAFDLNFWSGVGKDASKPPYTMGYSTTDPSNSYGLLKQNLFDIY